MELFASFNGPSDERFFAAVAAAALVSVLAGFFPQTHDRRFPGRRCGGGPGDLSHPQER
jgi:hypothetical protein